MIKADLILKSRYKIHGKKLDNLYEESEEWVTLVHFTGGNQLVQIEFKKESDLPIKPTWQSISSRGYHQVYYPPRDNPIFIDNPEPAYFYVLPENGAVFLFDTEQDINEWLN